MLFGDVAACHRAECVLCAVHSAHLLVSELHRFQNARCNDKNFFNP
jgi:hypothetical protein